MERSGQGTTPFRVGEWLCEPLSYRVSAGNQSTQIEPKVMHVLACLASRPGEVVTRRELLDTVWADTVVTEQVLSRAISELRKVFDDDPRAPRFIETIAKSGYRLLPRVEKLPNGRAASAASSGDAHGRDASAPSRMTPQANAVSDGSPAESSTAQLDSVGRPTPGAAPVASRRAVSRGAVLVLGIVMGIVLATLFRDVARRGAARDAATESLPASAAPKRLSLLLPAEAPPELSWFRCFDITPDGGTLIYTASLDGQRQLYRKRLDEKHAVAIHGTEGGYGPFVSRDGTQVGFYVAGNLRRVPLEGGQPVTLCSDASDPVGATWADDGTLVFTRRLLEGLSWIRPAEPVTKLTELRTEAFEGSHLWPQFLPDNEHVLFTVWRGGSIRGCDIELLHVASGERRTLIDGGSDARILADGRVLFARDGTLLQVNFDLERLEVVGAPHVLVEDLFTHPVTGAAHYAVAHDGTIVYVARDAFAAGRVLQRVDRDGRVETLSQARSFLATPRLAPDGTRLAATVAVRGMQIWLFDVERGGVERVTREGFNFMPAWKANGRELAFSSDRDGAFNLYTKLARSDAPVRRLTESAHMQFASSWSPDGRWLAYSEFHPESRWDVWLLPMPADASTREKPDAPVPFLVTSFDEFRPTFSPDGRALAYVSNEAGRWDEAGRWEVYVRLLDAPDVRVQVSTQGGTDPRWSPDGTQVLYRQGARLLETRVDVSPTLRVGETHVVHEGLEMAQTVDVIPTYDVDHQGRVVTVGLGTPLQATALTVLLGTRP